MAYDDELADRVRRIFADRNVAFEEKRMMGGLCFMVDGKMCVGVEKERLMARIDPGVYDTALGRKGCVPMDFTGKPMRGFVFVNAEGVMTKRDLESWLDLALEFNPRAVSSKKKSAMPKSRTRITGKRPKTRRTRPTERE
jgi:TfoX/Sxy family transcriptional regulator of competence genes